MKSTINSKTYDTETATEIARDGYPGSCSDFQNWDEALYVTDKGNYFLHGSGGPLSKYAESVGNDTRGGEAIVTMTKLEALAWCEKHKLQEPIDTHFADMVQPA